ncbi:MAG: alpha/beta fold hydrolase [Phycisphaerales bacterium]|nr:alpha/beta hydrolase [Phycisphaerales bacterium]
MTQTGATGQHATGSQLTSGRDLTLRGRAGPVPATVEEVGSGAAVVFLHGLVGLNEHWEEVVRLSEPSVRCIMLQVPLLDLRGEDCSIDGVTALTIDFLEQSFDHPVVLVGNSFGGHVALRVALQRPDLVRGLVLAGSSGLIEKSMVSDIQLRPSREWLERKIGELFYDPSTHMRRSDIERAHQQLSERGGARAMVRLSRSARKNHLGSRMSGILAPTLLIWGKQDIVTPPEAAQQFAGMLPKSKLVWFDRCGHVPMMEHPEPFARELTEFVDSLGPERAE